MAVRLRPVVLWGNLELSSDENVSVEFNGIELGSPEASREVLASLLSDGDLSKVTRRGNRTISLSIVTQDADLAALADLGAALDLEARKDRNTLTIDPGDGLGAVTVFETFEADLSTSRDDILEAHGRRRFTATIPAMPFARSVSVVTESAESVPDGSSGTLVDACESTTNWSANGGTLSIITSAFTQGTGAIAATRYSVESYGTSTSGQPIYGSNYKLARSSLGLDVTSGGGYLSFDYRCDEVNNLIFTSGDISSGSGYSGYNFQKLTLHTSAGDRVYITPATHPDWLATPVTTPSTGVGYTRYTTRISETITITGITFETVGLSEGTLPSGRLMRVDNIRINSTASTSQQVIRQIDVKGSARATGSLHVISPDDSIALGQVVAFTIPTRELNTGFRPEMRPWASSGTTATDTSASYGSYLTAGSAYDTSGNPVFEAPASLFKPGAYTIVGRLKRPSGAGDSTFGVEAALKMSGTVFGSPSTLESTVTFDDGAWTMVDLGTMYLPPYEVDNPTPAATVRLRFKSSDSIRIDDIFVLPISGDLTIVDCGTGTVGATASSHLWIDSPSPDQPQGGYWRGTAATRSDAIAAWADVLIPGIHKMEPESMTAFVASTAAQGLSVDFSYFPRWLFHAAL